MKLIIDLPEEEYEDIINSEDCGLHRLTRAVARGKQLPKGHGVLKDADAMINKLCTNEASELFGSITCAEIMDFINDEKSIIEADKAESEVSDADSN